MFAKKAMLVELTIRQWSARKHDRSATNAVAATYNAASATTAGRYDKYLISKAAIEKIATRANAIRAYHYRNTLPWGTKGQHLLPAKHFMEYRRSLQHLKGEFNNEVQAFLDRYDYYVDEARQRLGALYDPADYPPVSEVAKRYSIDLEILPVPDSGDFRVDVANEERQELMAQVASITQARQAEATKACVVRVRDVLQRMKQQCLAERPRITDALVEDIHELAGSLDGLNFNDDPELQRITQEIRQDLLFDVSSLRQSPVTRRMVGERADQILQSMQW